MDLNKSNNGKIFIKLSLAISIIYIIFICYIIFSSIYKAQHSSDLSAGAGTGLLIAFMSFHILGIVVSTIFNFIISLNRINSKVLIIITIILYIISGILAAIFINYAFLTVIIQIILLILAIFK